MPASRPPPMKNTGNLVVAVRAIRRTVTATWQRRPRTKASEVAAGLLTSARSWRRPAQHGGLRYRARQVGRNLSIDPVRRPIQAAHLCRLKRRVRPNIGPVAHAGIENPAFSVLARPGRRIPVAGLRTAPSSSPYPVPAARGGPAPNPSGNTIPHFGPKSARTSLIPGNIPSATICRPFCGASCLINNAPSLRV